MAAEIIDAVEADLADKEETEDFNSHCIYREGKHLKTFDNPCIRCGKQRIASKKWKEYIGKSLVYYVSNICPDPQCQKIVETGLNDKKEYLEAIQTNSLMRREENRRNRKFPKKIN